MIVFYGSRLYGTIERCGPTRIATRFFHFQFLPLFPLGSHLVVEDHGGGAMRTVPIPLSLRSVAAAYLRTWGLVAAAVAVFIAIDHRGASRFATQSMSGALLGAGGIAMLATCAVLCAVFAGVCFGMGALSREERARRRVYAAWAGVPVDVAHLPQGPGSRRELLQKEVQERARTFASTGYRTAFDPVQEWDQIVLQPAVREPQLLRAALTLARMEWAASGEERRAALSQSHGAIWRKLKELDPAVLAEPLP